MADLQLFNLNACIGCGAYEEPEYPDIRSLIKHLDYLEINRTLVSHIEARDVNPTWGNRRLLREIEASGFSERLIPAFVIHPTCYYEKSALGFLKENLISGKVRALRIYTKNSYHVSFLDKILSELAQWKPAVFCDCNTINDSEQAMAFGELAGKFPEMSFVITQAMWKVFGSVIDAMSKHKNIYSDISWLHMCDTAKLIVEEFGAERLLFSIGHKTHYGASIAALAHYKFSKEQKDLIAHGNLEKILNIKALPSKLTKKPALLEQKPLWKKCKSGLPLKNISVIDIHAHTTPFSRCWYTRNIDPHVGTAMLIEQMDRLGVKKTIITPENALVGHPLEGSLFWENILSAHGNRFSGYLVFNPRYGDEIIEQANAFFKRGFFIGFKILPSYWGMPASDPGYEPMWRYANKYKLPILSHTWDDSYNSPVMFVRYLNKYPDATLIMGHSGGGDKGRLEAEALAPEYNNVFFEFCGTFTAKRPFETTLQTVGGDRVVFGSDTVAHNAAWELGRYLSMPLPDAELTPGLGSNAEKIFAKAVRPNTMGVSNLA